MTTGRRVTLWRSVNGLHYEVIVAAFLVVWVGSVALYKWRRLDERHDTGGDGGAASDAIGGVGGAVTTSEAPWIDELPSSAQPRSRAATSVGSRAWWWRHARR